MSMTEIVDLVFTILGFEMLMYTFLGVLLSFLLIFIMHFLIPRNILETYFKEPYFRQSEVTTFSGFPFGYIRTVMFMRILGFPASGKKRGVEKAYEIAPVWFCKLSKYIVIFFLISFVSFSLVIGISGLHMMLYG